MTRDDIIRMAAQVESEITGHDFPHSDEFIEWCERFAALVAAAEREACAELAEKTICDTHIPTGINIYGSRAAKAIRARGQQ